MQDDLAALFAYDRWANAKVLDACRKLTAEQYAAELAAGAAGAGGWSSVRSTVSHIAWVTDLHLRTLAADGDPQDSGPVTSETDLATVEDAARLLERAYCRFEKFRPTLTRSHTDRAEWVDATLTLRGSDPRIGDYTFALPRWAMLRHIVNHSTYHRGQVASKLKRFGVEQANTDFFFWAVERVPQAVRISHEA